MLQPGAGANWSFSDGFGTGRPEGMRVGSAMKSKNSLTGSFVQDSIKKTEPKQPSRNLESRMMKSPSLQKTIGNSRNTDRNSPDSRSLMIRIEYLQKEIYHMKEDLETKAAYIIKLESYLCKNLTGKTRIDLVEEFTMQKKAMAEKIREMESNLEQSNQTNRQATERIKTLERALQIHQHFYGDEMPQPNNLQQDLSRFLVELSAQQETNEKLRREIERLNLVSRQAQKEKEEILEVNDELRIIREANSEELTKQEVNYQNLTREISSLKAKLSESSKEKHDLLAQLEHFKKKVKSLLEKELENHQDLENVHNLKLQLEKRELEYISLRKELENYHKNTKDAYEKFQEGAERVKVAESANTKLREEIAHFQEEFEKLHEESEYYKKRSIDLLKEKDELREGLTTRKVDRNVDGATSKPKRSKSTKKLANENKKLKAALEEAITRCAALSIKDKETDDVINNLQIKLEQAEEAKKLVEQGFLTSYQQRKSRREQEFLELSKELNTLREENLALKRKK